MREQMLTDSGDYGLLIAAPLIDHFFMLVTLVLAFLNRAAPSLNLFSVGMSIRAGLGVFCLFLFRSRFCLERCRTYIVSSPRGH